jgi:hypothetical protein
MVPDLTIIRYTCAVFAFLNACFKKVLVKNELIFSKIAIYVVHLQYT